MESEDDDEDEDVEIDPEPETEPAPVMKKKANGKTVVRPPEDVEMKDVDETDEEDIEAHDGDIPTKIEQPTVKRHHSRAKSSTPRSRIRQPPPPSGAPASPPATPVDD